jgi:hypothetical protein
MTQLTLIFLFCCQGVYLQPQCFCSVQCGPRLPTEPFIGLPNLKVLNALNVSVEVVHFVFCSTADRIEPKPPHC